VKEKNVKWKIDGNINMPYGSVCFNKICGHKKYKKNKKYKSKNHIQTEIDKYNEEGLEEFY